MAQAQSEFQHNTVNSLQLAVRLEPRNAAYHALLAEHIEGAGRSPEPDLTAAARLSPFDANYKNRLGFLYEVEQRYPAAEQSLLRAAQLDRGFRPRWALMNYYFRRGNSNEFWHWARQSLRRSYGDLTPVFRLCWEQTSDSQVIERALPNDPDFRLRYLEFLNAEKPPAAARRIAQAVASEMAPGDDPEAPVIWCNRSIGQDTASALAVWNILCQRKVLPFVALNPLSGDVVTNGDFHASSPGRGFDWRIRPVERLRTATGPSGLMLAFDGSQPEIFDLLEQPIPLARFHRYRFSTSTQIAPDGDATGLRWHIDLPDSRVLAEGDVPTGAGIQQQEMTFDAGGAELAYVHLTFRRPSGRVRWSGRATILNVAIQAIQ